MPIAVAHDKYARRKVALCAKIFFSIKCSVSLIMVERFPDEAVLRLSPSSETL